MSDVKKPILPVNVGILFFGHRSTKSDAHRVSIATRDSISIVKHRPLV